MTAGNTTPQVLAADVAGPVSATHPSLLRRRYRTVPGGLSLPQINAIVEAAGGLPVKTKRAIDNRICHLTDTLQNLTGHLLLGRFKQHLPSAFWLRRKMELIESFSNGLIKTLEIQGNDPPTIPDELYTFLKRCAAQYGGTNIQGREEFEVALASILLLREWARAGIDLTSRSVEEGKISGKSRRAPDLALRAFYDGLGRIWRDVFGKRPTVSVDRIDGSTGGAFFRFVKGIFAALRENLTPDMKKADPTLLKYLSPTDHAMRNRIQSMLKSASQKC